MTSGFPEWAYLVDESGRYWYHLQNGTRLDAGQVSEDRAPQRALFAIPAHDLVSHPHWISSKDEQIISEVVRAENEKLGVKTGVGPGRIADWKPVEVNGSRTLVQSISIPWTLGKLVDGPTQFTDFLPQHALFSPPENAVVLWREAGAWVAGYSRGTRWAHVQPLGDISPADASGEIQLTLMELEAKGIVESSDRLVVWAEESDELRDGLAPLGLPVVFRPAPAPSTSVTADWDFEPHEVSIARIAKVRRKQTALGIAFAALALLLLAAAGFLHLKLLESDNERLRSRISANREAADEIDLAMDRWQAISPAVEPDRNPLELFHRVSILLPEKGFRLTEFDFSDHRTVVVKGEASTMANALQMKGALEKSEELTDFTWEIPPPRTKNDLTEFSAIGSYRF